MGDNGNLVPVKDVAGLTSALQREIERIPETRRRRGHNQTQLHGLQDRFSVVRMVTETGRLYEKLLGHKN